MSINETLKHFFNRQFIKCTLNGQFQTQWPKPQTHLYILGGGTPTTPPQKVLENMFFLRKDMGARGVVEAP